MKHLATVFNALRGVLMVALTGLLAPVSAQESGAVLMDSVEISLLTCAPHDEVYSLYGHTAIRYHDLRSGGIDAAFNYGVFNFHAPYFVLRFVFGLTDYELGAYPFSLFQREYRHYGSMVTEQVLDLTNEEKLRLRTALDENLRPENRVYRYNFFYNNCTTKARDIIEQSVIGQIEYAARDDYQPTFRDIVHEMTRNNPWARFGNDLLLGLKADQQIDLRQQEFLPANLLHDFDRAHIYANGQYRPLVRERRTAVPPGVQMTGGGFPLTPLACAVLTGILALALFAYEWKARRALLIWDLVLMFTTGLIGTVLLLMIFSQHPTVSLNLQFVLLNPLPFFFLPAAVRHRPSRYWAATAILAVLFLIGGLFQHYAEGIQVLALCLLLQSYIHLKKASK